MSTVISLCEVEECEKRRIGLGLCSMHYQRFKKYGTTDPRKMPTEQERFWSKVDKTDGCWVWVAARYSNGYGHFGVNATRGATAHKYAWEFLNGKVPNGLVLDHTCHNRLCCNPRHLRTVTMKQNLENMSGLRSDNTSGVRGVHRHGNGRHWVTRVEHHGVVYSAGLFLEIEEAAVAVLNLRNELFTHNDLDRKQS